ncbi:MAG: lytic transglycosylase domain-containing protein [bacterium]
MVKSKQKNRKRTIAIICVAVLIGFIWLTRYSSAPCVAQPQDTVSEFHKSITSLQLPTEATLFGAKIPLDKWEVRERFEREFYYNYNNCDQLVMWWKRLGRWEVMIDSMLDADSLPRDFKFLMIAESGIRNVQSPAHANGYWQFLTPTAQRFGLRVDQYIDERLDPILSTQAAIRFISSLKRRFNADYLLCAAAYNMGEEGLSDAMDFQKQKSYWNLMLSEETMRYPIRIAVIKELLEHNARYGLQLEKLAPYKMHGIKHVSAQGPIPNIAEWAIGQGYSYKDFKFFNPRFIAHEIPRGLYDIRLPEIDADRTTVY